MMTPAGQVIPPSAFARRDANGFRYKTLHAAIFDPAERMSNGIICSGIVSSRDLWDIIVSLSFLLFLTFFYKSISPTKERILCYLLRVRAVSAPGYFMTGGHATSSSIFLHRRP